MAEGTLGKVRTCWMGGVLRGGLFPQSLSSGWLVRQKQPGCSQRAGLWLAELGEWWGRGPMSTPAGRQRWVGHQWAERSEGQGVMG